MTGVLKTGSLTTGSKLLSLLSGAGEETVEHGAAARNVMSMSLGATPNLPASSSTSTSPIDGDPLDFLDGVERSMGPSLSTILGSEDAATGPDSDGLEGKMMCS